MVSGFVCVRDRAERSSLADGRRDGLVSPTKIPPAPLRSSRQIGRVLKTGTRRTGAYLSAHALDSSESSPKVAVVAGRRTGGAVGRNRAKRRLRAAIRAVGLPAGADFVVLAKPSAKSASFQDLQEELKVLVADAARRQA